MDTAQRVCARCKELKSLNEFYRAHGTRQKVQSYCKPCHNSYTTARFRARKRQAVAYLGGRCADCSGIFPYYVYEFHHRDPSQKEMQFNSLRRRSWKAMKVELDKCILLCANCHRVRHWQEFDDECPPSDPQYHSS